MSGLRPPPKDSPGRAVGRIIFLIVLLTVLAVIVWAAVVNQNIGLVENESLEDIDIANGQTVGDLTINVNESGNSPVPVVLLHDSDITGSPIFARLVATLGEDVRVILVDLPGFGLSSRIPGEAPGHTVSSMAGAISEVIATRTEGPAVLVGVGLGGEVAAEIAVNPPGEPTMTGPAVADHEEHGPVRVASGQSDQAGAAHHRVLHAIEGDGGRARGCGGESRTSSGDEVVAAP